MATADLVRRRRFGIVAGVAAAVVASAVTAQAERSSRTVSIEVLSNRADLISGGDAYVQVVLPVGADAHSLRVQLDRRDISDAFAMRRDGRILGLVEGMNVGAHQLTARANGATGARIALQNHPIGGPIFAGAQPQPFFCETEALGLGPARDAQCNAPTRYRWYYMPADPAATELVPYAPAHPASDVRRVTTDQGHQVPYIVRDERGVIDRGVYDIAVLYEPKASWEPWAPQSGWNGKLLFRAGAGCSAGHVQDDFHDAVLKKPMLERGYAVLTSGATNMARTCNEVVGAEALMMLKEHVVERYGPIRFTIGEGCSGGGILPLDIAANYPGLLNGLLPGCSYPDYWTVGQMNLDCGLLIRAFDAADEDGSRWSAERDRAATTGLGDSQGCRDGAGRWQQLLRPDVPDSCIGQGVLASRPDFDTGWVYSTKTNPTGVRCTLQDYQETLFGRRADGKANRAYDNVGVQYGLRALQAGGITAAQFIDLNRRVGGYDIDGNWQPQRSVADPPAVTRAYRGGRVISAGALQDVAIISSREYVDDGHDGAPHEEGWHTRVYDYSLRDRLQRDTGSVDNQVIVTAHTYERAHEPTYDPLDRWLSAVERDTSNRSLAEKLRIDRPAYVVDTCFDHGNQIIAEHACDAVYPVNSLPRRVAGGPDTDDVIKCQLKPLDRGDYPTSLSDAEFDQLLAIFPDGVCDYVRPGVGQGSSVAWLSYAEGPDGTPLGPPPTSSPLP